MSYWNKHDSHVESMQKQPEPRQTRTMTSHSGTTRYHGDCLIDWHDTSLFEDDPPVMACLINHCLRQWYQLTSGLELGHETSRRPTNWATRQGQTQILLPHVFLAGSHLTVISTRVVPWEGTAKGAIEWHCIQYSTPPWAPNCEQCRRWNPEQKQNSAPERLDWQITNHYGASPCLGQGRWIAWTECTFACCCTQRGRGAGGRGGRTSWNKSTTSA